MTKTKSIYLALLAVLLSPLTANADLITVELEDILIGGTLYDVVLHQDDSGLTAFNSVYGDSESPFFTFTSELGATMAAQALFNYAVAENIDLSPNSAGNAAVVPFSANADLILGYMVAYVSQRQIRGPFGGEGYSRETANFGGSFATFSVSQVPEPATLALFGLGLLGIGFARRRKA